MQLIYIYPATIINMLHKDNKSKGSSANTWEDILEPGEGILPAIKTIYQIPVLHTVMSLADTEYSPRIFAIVCAIKAYEKFVLKPEADNGEGDMLDATYDNFYGDY